MIPPREHKLFLLYRTSTALAYQTPGTARKAASHGTSTLSRRYQGLLPTHSYTSTGYICRVAPCRLFADQLAAEGFLVLLPDIFHDDAWPEDGDWAQFPAWIEKHPIETEMLQINRLLTDVHQIYQPKSLCCVGFCWGGRHCVKLASTDKVDAAAIAHGSFIQTEEVEAVSQPILFLYADEVSIFCGVLGPANCLFPNCNV